MRLTENEVNALVDYLEDYWGGYMGAGTETLKSVATVHNMSKESLASALNILLSDLRYREIDTEK